MFIPLGYGEVELIPHDSVWHPIVGWCCFAVPTFVASHIMWKRLAKIAIRKLYRIVAITMIASGFLGIAGLAINSFLAKQQESEQEEISRNLTAHVLPPLTENAMESVFSLANGSGKTAISSGMLYCGINQILGDKDGVPVSIGKLSSTAVPNASGLIPGDSRSEPCLMIWSTLVKRTQCVDMKLWMRYSIEPQPSVTREKWF